MNDMTPQRRAALRREQRNGLVDAWKGAAFAASRSDGDDPAMLLSYLTGWHIGREESLAIPIPPQFNPIDGEDYARGLFCEEVGEALTVLGSGWRFGIDTPGRESDQGASPREVMAKEMGDVLAAIEYACQAGCVSRTQVEEAKKRKLTKLLSPDSRDNKGRRLAPPPVGFDPVS